MSKTSNILRHLTNKRAITRAQATIIVAVVVIAVLGAAAWYFMTPPPAPVKKIAVVSDIGGRGELSFNDMGFKGGDEAAKAF